jgi:hypothetical protein
MHDGTTQCIHHAGFQSKLQVQSTLARAVTMDNEVDTNSRTLHTLNVVRQPIEYPAHIQISMTLPTRPTLFLARCKAHKNPILQRAKNANAQPTLADDYLSSFVRHFSNISLPTPKIMYSY